MGIVRFEAGTSGDPDYIAQAPLLTSHERPLTVERARDFFNKGVAIAAAQTWDRIQIMAQEGFVLPEKERKKVLDNYATVDLAAHFANADFGIVVLGCEGKKELRKDGIELETLEGFHGDPQGLRLELFADPIEGTTAAASNRVGSVAIVAGGLENGHNLVPPEDGDAQYMERIVAGPRLKGKISLDMSTGDIVRVAMEGFSLSDSSQLKVVVLERARNAKLIEGLETAGVTVVKIDAGDLMPALAALKQQPIISMGSGGKEEAMIAAIAAKARGGVFEGRYVDKDGNASLQHPQALDLDNLCPGDPKKYFVSLASITGTPSHGLGLLRVIPRGLNGKRVNQVSVVDVTHRGFRSTIIEV